MSIVIQAERIKRCLKSSKQIAIDMKIFAEFVSPLLLGTPRRRGRGMRSPSIELGWEKPMDQKQFARHLPQCQNTYEELLWQLICNRCRCNKKFRRQHPIGIYTVEFYCAEERIVIEVDGRDHFKEQGRLHDEARVRFMIAKSIRVLRFTGKHVELETEWVLAQIDQALGSPSLGRYSPDPFSPSTGRRAKGSSGYSLII